MSKTKTLEELGMVLPDPSSADYNYCFRYFKPFRQCYGLSARGKQYYSDGKKASCASSADMLSACLKMSLSSDFDDRKKYYDEYHAKNPPYSNRLWTARDVAPSDFQRYKATTPDEKRVIILETPLNTSPSNA
jgi:hypothetical protein